MDTAWLAAILVVLFVASMVFERAGSLLFVRVGTLLGHALSRRRWPGPDPGPGDRFLVSVLGLGAIALPIVGAVWLSR